MKLPSYTQAPGLDRFPEKERFAVYLSAHQRLMQGDTTYRGRCRSYWAAVVCLALVPVLGWAILLWLAFRQQNFQNQRIGELLNGTA
jgi:hypothetical protein